MVFSKLGAAGSAAICSISARCCAKRRVEGRAELVGLERAEGRQAERAGPVGEQWILGGRGGRLGCVHGGHLAMNGPLGERLGVAAVPYPWAATLGRSSVTSSTPVTTRPPPSQWYHSMRSPRISQAKKVANNIWL